MRRLATPSHRRPFGRLDPASLAVAAGVIALALALVCVLAFVSVGLADRRGQRR
jgi:hypothetical protein